MKICDRCIKFKTVFCPVSGEQKEWNELEHRFVMLPVQDKNWNAEGCNNFMEDVNVLPRKSQD